MHRICKFMTGIAAVAAFGAAGLVATAPRAQAQAAQAQPQQKKKAVKDQGEYDLFTAVTKETDPGKKVQLLDQWKAKYPESDYKAERLAYYEQAYAAQGAFQKVIDTAKEVLALNPKDVTALYWINFLTPVVSATNPAPDALDQAEKAANSLLQAEMPEGTKPEDWQKAKKDLDALAHKTLGWVALQRKNFELSEKELRQSLEMKANDAQAAMWLGNVLRNQKTPEGQSAALFEFARSVVLEPKEGGLAEPVRKQMDTYLTKAYGAYHGQDDAGLAQLKEQAKASALPPPGFKIESATEKAIRQEEEFRKSNPMLALWLSLKKELTGDNGQKFFDERMKGAAVPGGVNGIQKFKGTIVEAKPEAHSKELIVGISDPKVPEVTIKLDAPVTGKPVIGSVVEFEGVPSAFSKDPFMVTFDVEKSKLAGLEEEKITPRRAPVRRKSAAKKK